MVPGAADSQAYDRYSYSRNNPVRFFDPDGHAPRCNNDNGEGGGCEGLSRPIPGIRHKGYTRLTPAGETAYLAFQRYLESDLPDKTVTGFVTLILAGEFNGIEESNVRRSTGGSSYAAFQTYIAEAAAHQLYSRFGAGSLNDSAMLNWMGEYMDSYFSRLIEPNYVFTYDGISLPAQELSKNVMNRIINSPAEWRRPDYGSTEHNNYWNGQYQPLNWEPMEWGNGLMYPGVEISGVLSGYTYWYIDDPNPDKRFYVLSIEESNLLTNALSNK